MHINRHTSLLLAAAVALAVAAPAAADKTNDPQGAKDTTKDYTEFACGDDDGDTIAFNSDRTLWPPNHKYSPLSVTVTDNEDDEDLTLSTSVSHDEYLAIFAPTEEDQEEPEELNGSGNTINDASPFWAMAMEGQENGADADTGEEDVAANQARTVHEIRAERSGRGDGRTYTISYTVMDGMEEECSGDFFVEVPHDMRSANGEENGKNGGASLNEDGSPKGGGNS